jgi:hypothetical protein
LDAIDRQTYAAASIQATLYNAHFDTKGVPWTPEDLLGRGDREQRKQQALESKIFTSRMISDSKGNAIPEWALEVERTSKGLVN